TLFLNVAAILIVRPFQLFGRRQVDFRSPCPRKSYLAVAKGVRRGGPGSATWGSVGGGVAEDVFLHLAGLPAVPAGPEDRVVAAALSATTIGALAFFGLANRADLGSALGKGR